MPFIASQSLQKLFNRSWSINLISAFILLLLVIFTPLILASAYTTFHFFQLEERRINKSNEEYVKVLSFLLDSQFRNIESSLLGLRYSLAITGNNILFYDLASKFSKEEGLLGVVLVDHSKQILLLTTRPYGEKLPKVSGVMGETVNAVFKEGKASVSSLFISPVANEWLMSVGVPIFNPNGKVRYVLLGIYSAKQLNDSLEAQASSNSDNIFFIDPLDRIAAGSNSPLEVIGQMNPPEFRAYFGSRASGSFKGSNIENIPVSVSYYQSPVTKWTASIANPISDIRLWGWSQLRVFIGVRVLAFIIALLLGLWAILKISSSIKNLIPYAESLGLRKRISPLVGYIKEINALAHSMFVAALHLEDADYKAHHDELTGLANRALINFNLTQQIALADREGYFISLLYLDIDDFKNINDIFGHDMGDVVLQEVSLRLKSAVRASDVIGRLGGDEFIILLVNVDDKTGQLIAHKILDSITCAPVIFGATEINVSCSIGLAMYPTCASDEVNLHKRADQALYVAKRLGKNQVFETFNTVDSEELATKEQACQNEEKIKRAAELFITNKELSFQEGEKAKRASELVDTIMKLESANIKAEQSELQLFSSLSALAKVRDNETWNHIMRTQHYVSLLALRLHSEGHYIDLLSDQGITSLVKAAPLHDIGKVGIPDSILLKNGPLTDEEWTIMKTHTLIGESVLGFEHIDPDAISDVVAKAIKIAGGHHEKWDGTGYPRGLAGEAIPLEARIMSLADVYDALVSKRVYKKAWSHEEAVQEIISKRGIEFDPLIVDAFIAEQDTFREIGQAYPDY